MTQSTQLVVDRRNRLLEMVQQELARFERKESEFRKRDRAERAAELHLPLDNITVQ